MSQPVAFFDVDKTLCNCYSGYHTTVDLIRLKIIKKRRLLKAIYYNTIGRMHLKADVYRMYEIALQDMSGTKLIDILEIGRKTFETKVKPMLYQEGIDEIEKLRQEGFMVGLLTSGPYMLIKNMEQFLGLDFSFSNGPVIRDGILQKEVQRPLVYKEGKVEVAEAFLAEHGIHLQDCKFYSDSISDLPLLEKVGYPVAVNPDKKLRKVAIERGWPIRDFTKMLG